MAYTILTNVSGLADPGLARAWQAGEVSAEAPLSTLATIFPWSSGSYDQALAAPVTGYASQLEGAAIVPEEFAQIGTSTVTPAEYSLAYSLSATAYGTLPMAVKMRAFAGLGAKAARFWEAQLASKWNNAEGSTTVINGQALGSNAHPLAVGTMDNLHNAALSYSAYEAAVLLLQAQVDYRGDTISARPGILLASSSLLVTAQQVLTGTHTAADDRSLGNVLAGSSRLIFSSDLNTGAWFLIDPTHWAMQGGMSVPVTIAPAPEEQMPSQLTNYRYVVSSLISAGFANPTQPHGVVVGNT